MKLFSFYKKKLGQKNTMNNGDINDYFTTILNEI